MANFDRPLSGCAAQMEPAISDDVMPHEMASLASIAISLKRIADALTPDDPRNSFIYKALAEPLNHYGEGIGECTKGQFNRSGQ